MRVFDDTTMRAIYSEESGEVFLALLEIATPSLDEPLRAVNDSVDHRHKGDLYTAFPFEFVLPPSDGVSLPKLAVRISNVSLKLIELIRMMEDPINIKLIIVLASDIDNVKIEVEHMTLRKVDANAQIITFSIMEPTFLSSAWVQHRYTAKAYRGLHK